MPRPMKRERKTSRLESAWPGRGLALETKTALKGSLVVAARGSGCEPVTISSQSEVKRVSLKNRPWGEPAAVSPDRPQMEKVEPSTRVTVPSAGRRDPDSPAHP